MGGLEKQAIIPMAESVMNCMVLFSLFFPSQIGGVHHVLMSRKKKGKAIVSFFTSVDAVSLYNIALV